MSIMSTISRLAHAYRVRRDAARTERMIGALPTEIRKDIGWPDNVGPRGAARNGAWHAR